MKDLSFLGLHNSSLGLKMNKGLKNLCTGDASTSTLNQQQQQQPTLEEMIKRLDLEEKMATRAKLQEYAGDVHHRMSCVNSSDILRSARNALNQYPRFSLDGRDAMYRSSFRNNQVDLRSRCLPTKVAGERVIWCKPGVVGKLMGLDAMPIPIRLKHRRINSSILSRKQNLRRKCLETQQMERRKLDHHLSRATTATGYCVRNPVVAVDMARDEAGWPMRRFL